MKKLQQQAKEREAAAAAAKAAEAAVKEKDAQRKWILQYAEDDSESDPDDESSKVGHGMSVSESLCRAMLAAC